MCLSIYRLIQRSSPNLNYIIILGAVSMYMSIFIPILPFTSATLEVLDMAALCVEFSN